jgi:hypothetical protein
MWTGNSGHGPMPSKYGGLYAIQMPAAVTGLFFATVCAVSLLKQTEHVPAFREYRGQTKATLRQWLDVSSAQVQSATPCPCCAVCDLVG